MLVRADKMLDHFAAVCLCVFACVNTQSAQTDQRRLRVGRWMIQSQSLDGQQLQSTDWILPRFRPSPPGQLPHRSPKARVLNADLLENPGAGIRGRLSKPSFAEVWLPHLDGSGEDILGKESETVHTVLQKRSGQTSPSQLEPDVYVINNGTAPQVIILPESEFEKKKLISQLNNLQKKGEVISSEGRTRTPSADQIINPNKDLAESNVLTEILEDLDKESQLRKLHLLKQRLQHKTEVHQATVISEANKRLTDVGVSLHKQGQILHHFTATPSVRSQTVRQAENNSPVGNKKTQELLQKKRRLQNLLKSLRLLAQAKKNIAALQPSLKLQEKILNNNNFD